MKGTVVFFNHRSLLQRKNCLIDIFLQTTGLFFKGIFIKIDGFLSTRRLYFIEIFINELSLYVYGALKISFNYSLSIVFFLLLNQIPVGTVPVPFSLEPDTSTIPVPLSLEPDTSTVPVPLSLELLLMPHWTKIIDCINQCCGSASELDP